jgi:SM-20-related protein
MNPPPLRFNPAIDLDAAARTFRRDGMVQIADVLAPESAEHLLRLTETSIDWDLAFQGEDGRPAVLTRGEVEALGENGLRRRLGAMMQKAGEGYGFLYLAYPLISAYLAGRDPGHPVHALTEFLNADFTELGRRVTGRADIAKADGQLTLYRPGDFIGLHNDVGSEKSDRLVAYTFGLTRRWRPDWGGQLLFHDPAGDVIHGHAPRWNTLTLFNVPQDHSVAPVAAYARAPRLSVVGWLRNAGV